MLAISDSTGTLVQSYGYDPYGNLTSSSGSVANPFQFQGQYLDSVSGLYYLRARFYDPTTGQFMSVDPLVMITRHYYGFAWDDPANVADPSGQVWWVAIVIVVVVVALILKEIFDPNHGRGDLPGDSVPPNPQFTLPPPGGSTPTPAPSRSTTAGPHCSPPYSSGYLGPCGSGYGPGSSLAPSPSPCPAPVNMGPPQSAIRPAP